MTVEGHPLGYVPESQVLASSADEEIARLWKNLTPDEQDEVNRRALERKDQIVSDFRRRIRHLGR